jgi:hypothetical protein
MVVQEETGPGLSSCQPDEVPWSPIYSVCPAFEIPPCHFPKKTVRIIPWLCVFHSSCLIKALSLMLRHVRSTHA